MLHKQVSLKDLRESCGVTQEELAERTGFQQNSISRLERQDDIKLSTLKKYVEGLGGTVSVHVMFPKKG
jgi:predicted transcriptional regulator